MRTWNSPRMAYVGSKGRRVSPCAGNKQHAPTTAVDHSKPHLNTLPARCFLGHHVVRHVSHRLKSPDDAHA